MRIFDIGANLTDGMFKGIYHGKMVHPPDVVSVLDRAKEYGIERIMITAGSLSETKEAIELVKEYNQQFPGMLSTTVGVHPTRVVDEFEKEGPEEYLKLLMEYIKNYKQFGIKAIGEFGLDYDRTQFATPQLQRKYFEAQFSLVEESKGLPLFLHMRDAAADLIEILKKKRDSFKDGVVHSFTGTIDEANQILDLDLYIGINGCSLKTEENLQVVKSIPINRIMIESDAPWCEIRPSHAGYSLFETKLTAVTKEKHRSDTTVKSRNEPLASRQVLEVLSSLHQVSVEELSETIFQTTMSVFG